MSDRSYIFQGDVELGQCLPESNVAKTFVEGRNLFQSKILSNLTAGASLLATGREKFAQKVKGALTGDWHARPTQT